MKPARPDLRLSLLGGLIVLTFGVGLILAVLQMTPPARWMLGALVLIMALWPLGKRLYWKWWLRVEVNGP